MIFFVKCGLHNIVLRSNLAKSAEKELEDKSGGSGF